MNIYIIEDLTAKAYAIMETLNNLQIKSFWINEFGEKVNFEDLETRSYCSERVDYFVKNTLLEKNLKSLAREGESLIILDLVLNRDEDNEITQVMSGASKKKYYHAPTAKAIIELFHEINNRHAFLIESDISEAEKNYLKIIWEGDLHPIKKIDFIPSVYMHSQEMSKEDFGLLKDKIDKLRG